MFEIIRPFDALLLDYIVSSGSRLLDWLLLQLINCVMNVLQVKFIHLLMGLLGLSLLDGGAFCRHG